MTTTPEQLVQVFPLPDCTFYGDSLGAPRVGHVHAGNDLMCPNGVPILSPTEGTYEVVDNSVGGLAFKVHHPGGGYVYGAHLQSHVASDGAHVTAGQKIAVADKTGNAASTAPHLHFEIHPNPTPPLTSLHESPYRFKVVVQGTGSPPAVDPYTYLKTAEEEEMAQFTADEEAKLRQVMALSNNVTALERVAAISPALIDFQRVENQATGRAVGALARFQNPAQSSVPPPRMFDIDGNGQLQETGPFFREGWKGMDDAILSGAVQIP
jgi:murein DD-endopeptidase MepM/ murein hydrolase activator NlpD